MEGNKLRMKTYDISLPLLRVLRTKVRPVCRDCHKRDEVGIAPTISCE
jgi:hypothetical protein